MAIIEFIICKANGLPIDVENLVEGGTQKNIGFFMKILIEWFF